jgi:hypothetical protein
MEMDSGSEESQFGELVDDLISAVRAKNHEKVKVKDLFFRLGCFLARLPATVKKLSYNGWTADLPADLKPMTFYALKFTTDTAVSIHDMISSVGGALFKIFVLTALRL